jgi:hypothetical protein
VPQAEIDAVIAEFKDVFSEPTKPGPDLGIGHTITLPPGHKPPYRPPYRMSPKEREACKVIIADLLNKGYIRPSTSPYGAPFFLVPKPGRPNEYRALCDFRALNKLSTPVRHPLANPLDLWDRMAGKQIFSIPKTAFSTPDGHFEWVVLAQGLCNSPATFNAVMNRVLAPYINKFVVCYADDLCLMSSSPSEHIQHLRLVLQR